MDTKTVTVQTTITAPIDKVWKAWTTPEDIMQWNNAADTWHTPRAENDLRVGGHFLSRMEAKDGSFGFDFGGSYDEVTEHEVIAYTLGDGRKVRITFKGSGNTTDVVETFDTENTFSIEQQQQGWQAILDNFKKYVESQ